jgi:type IX secretion system PorP/SprF family membrane protein
MRLSLGLALGIMQYEIDGTKFNWDVDNTPDPTLPPTVVSKIQPDASVGAYLYQYNFNVGLSVQQLFSLNTHFSTNNLGFSNLVPHIYLMGGYKYVIDREWAVEPGAVITFVKAAPLQLELSGKVIYRNIFWGGLAYRTGDAVSILLGYTYERKIYIAYAFAYNTSEINKFSFGSHELVLGYNFDSIKRQSKKKH